MGFTFESGLGSQARELEAGSRSHPGYVALDYIELESFGQAQGAGDAFRTLAGGATSEIARVLVSDPSFQSALNRTADRAEGAAYRGLERWFGKNWPWLVVAGLGLVVGNYVMIVTAIAQRDVRFKRRGVL